MLNAVLVLQEGKDPQRWALEHKQVLCCLAWLPAQRVLRAPVLCLCCAPEAPLNDGNHSDQGNGSELLIPGKSPFATKSEC